MQAQQARALTGALVDLDLLFAFEDLAAAKRWPAERNADDTGYADPTTQARWEGFEAAHGQYGRRPAGQQLYAEIKKTSEYAHQAAMARGMGEYPFRVRVAQLFDDYCVRGGPGGNYRLRDVNLYVIEDGKKYRLS